MTDDLIQRLRRIAKRDTCNIPDSVTEAADEIERLREELAAMTVEVDSLERNVIDQRAELVTRDLVIEQMRKALENARLFAARSRKEEWAVTVLRFCSEAGVTGSPLRSTTDALKLRDQKRDAELLRAVFDEFYVSKISLCNLADQRESGEWEPELEVK